MDENLVDKDGKPIELVKKANQNQQGNYYQKWLDSDKTKFEPTPEDLKCELQLSALDVWEPLKYEFDLGHFKKQMAKYEDKWVPYLRREGVVNNREGLCLMGMPGDDYNDGLSMPEARRRHGRKLDECDLTSSEMSEFFLNSMKIHRISVKNNRFR